MRHRRKGRTLGRCPSHQRALLRNLATQPVPDRARRRGRRQQAQGQGADHHHLAKGQGSSPAGRTLHHARLPQPSPPAGSRQAFATTAERNSRSLADLAQERQVAEVGQGHRAGRRCPPPGLAACWATSRPCGSCSTTSLRGLSAAPAATPASCGWPSPAWAMPARGRSWNSSAFAIASTQNRSGRPSKPVLVKRRQLNCPVRRRDGAGRKRSLARAGSHGRTAHGVTAATPRQSLRASARRLRLHAPHAAAGAAIAGGLPELAHIHPTRSRSAFARCARPCGTACSPA